MSFFYDRILSFCLITALTCILFYSVPVEARSFTVENVTVDQRGDPVSARENAFQEAQTKAFAALSNSLAQAGKTAPLPPSALSEDASIIASLIEDFEIIDEQIAPNRYAATYTFRFKREDVLAYLNSRPITDTGPLSPFDADQPYITGAERVERPYSGLFNNDQAPHNAATHAITPETSGLTLVLPYWQDGSQTILWGDRNQWLSSWQTLEQQQGTLGRFILPLGDLSDMSRIGDQIPQSAEALNALLMRYQAERALIAVARPTNSGLDIDLYQGTATNLVFLKTVSATLGSMTDPYAAAAQTALASLEQVDSTLSIGRIAPAQPAFPPNNLAQPSHSQSSASTQSGFIQGQAKITVTTRFASPQEWLEIRRALEGSSATQDIQVISLKPRSAKLSVDLNDSVEALRGSLYRRNLRLAPEVNGSGSGYTLGYFNANGV